MSNSYRDEVHSRLPRKIYCRMRNKILSVLCRKLEKIRVALQRLLVSVHNALTKVYQQTTLIIKYV